MDLNQAHSGLARVVVYRRNFSKEVASKKRELKVVDCHVECSLLQCAER